MSEDNCPDCGGPMDEHESIEAYPRVTEPYIVNCSVTEGDMLAFVVIQHPESEERRIAVECCEQMEDPPEDIYQALATGLMAGRVLLTAATARMFAANLLEAADVADRTETVSGTDWDTSMIEELGNGAG